MVGIREWWAYSSDRKLTRSIQTPWSFIRAVSKCLDCSGFDIMTATLCVSWPWENIWEMVLLFQGCVDSKLSTIQVNETRPTCDLRYSLMHSANSFPSILSNAISMSRDSRPMSLSLTQPPAHRRVVSRRACRGGWNRFRHVAGEYKCICWKWYTFLFDGGEKVAKKTLFQVCEFDWISDGWHDHSVACRERSDRRIREWRCKS